MKNLPPQQLVLAASGATIVAGAMLSRGNRLGLVLLALAVVCGIGAFAKGKRG
jgi:hypothetical protein